MYAMTRKFAGKGAAELARLLAARKGDVEKAMKQQVPGLVSYHLIQTEDGCVSFTLCRDKAGTDKSLSVAREWLKANAGHLEIPAPAVSEGKVIAHVGADVAASH
ncbi:MAG: hypothetical protein JSR87_01630 [Proteobacteria bacterium]|nr:hypothetical protein [Pseudomonadota bacterium]MBS0573953.1 hypothetical protein [Pseudomonadota bacterium]